MAPQEKKVGAQTFGAVVKVLIGLGLLILGCQLIWIWKNEVLAVIKGFVGITVILAGVIFLAIAKE
ncbi:MAG: hypothetical protein V1727_03230 [Candidatus Omnitrophota bacterium]